VASSPLAVLLYRDQVYIEVSDIAVKSEIAGNCNETQTTGTQPLTYFATYPE